MGRPVSATLVAIHFGGDRVKSVEHELTASQKRFQSNFEFDSVRPGTQASARRILPNGDQASERA